MLNTTIYGIYYAIYTVYMHIMAYIQHRKGREMYNVRHCNIRIVCPCVICMLDMVIYVCLAVLGLLQLNFEGQKGASFLGGVVF